MARLIPPLLALFLSATYILSSSAAAADPIFPDAVSSEVEPNIETVCKNTYDDEYCVRLLKPLVVPTTNFTSLKWNRAVLSKATTKARTAIDFMTKHAQGKELGFKQHSVLKDCLDSLESSVELLQQAAREYVEVYKFYGTLDFELHKSYVRSLMETASYDQENCKKTLLMNSKVWVMVEVNQHAEEAYKANKIASHVVLHV